jgi:hypothetical protein
MTIYNGMLPKDGAIAPKHVGVFYSLRSEVYVHLVGWIQLQLISIDSKSFDHDV